MGEIKQQDPEATVAKPKVAGSPVAQAWKVGVIVVLIGLAAGLLLLWIGSNRIKAAEQTRVLAESKLELAVAFTAQDAIGELRQARLAINGSNWGSAQSALLLIGQRIDLIQQIAPERKKPAAVELVTLKDELATAVSEHSSDTASKVDALEAALDALRSSGN